MYGKPVLKDGEIWCVGAGIVLELNKIYNMDCLEGMKKIEDNSIDLIVTSPPYNLSIQYDSYDDNKSLKDYFNWCNDWLKECYRVLKPDGRMCLNHYFSCGTSEIRFAPLMRLNYMAEDIGFKHHGIATWDDRTISKRTAWGSWISASAPYINSPYEGIMIMYKLHWKKEKPGISTILPKEFMESCSGIWKIQPEHKNQTIANFPVALASRCINLLSYKDEIILDPFMGAGTTAVAAKQSCRKYIGFEISEKYCKIAEKRLTQENIGEWF
jgi:site-specific DNA-methyltransferase (adenine-specific)